MQPVARHTCRLPNVQAATHATNRAGGGTCTLFCCDICGVYPNSESSYKSHLGSARHRFRLYSLLLRGGGMLTSDPSGMLRYDALQSRVCGTWGDLVKVFEYQAGEIVGTHWGACKHTAVVC